MSDEVRDLIHDVDVLLHDAQFVESERALADAYAHSTVDDAIGAGARVRRAARSSCSTTGRRAPTTRSTRIAAALDPPARSSSPRRATIIDVGRA